MKMFITYCEEKGTGNVKRFVWHSGDEEDVKSANVVTEYEATLEDGEVTIRSKPTDNVIPFFEVSVDVTDTHRKISKFSVGYKRLNFSGRYNEIVGEIMKEEYGVIKHNFRRGLLAAREEKGKKQ